MNDIMRDEILSLSGAKPKWSRRDFVVTSLASGFALSVQPVCAQTQITTDTQGLSAGETKIPVKDGQIPAYYARPGSGSNLPIVLVVQEIFGVHEHIKDVCRRLAKTGYLAVAPELYARQGDVSKMTNNKEIMANVVSKVPDEQVMADLDATAEWAAKNNGTSARLGITGFCWGGRVVWLYAAHNQNLKAGVAWYGPLDRAYTPGSKLTVLSLVDKINTPVLGLYGGADAGISNESVEKMRAALKAAGKMRSEIVLYPDTPHAFHADYRPTYRKEQADDGWKRLQEWFKKHL